MLAHPDFSIDDNITNGLFIQLAQHDPWVKSLRLNYYSERDMERMDKVQMPNDTKIPMVTTTQLPLEYRLYFDKIIQDITDA
jgi:hypothetical protein